MCETIALRQRGSWPKERSAPSRSYCGPSGAKSSIAWSRRSVISPYPGTVTLVADLERIAAAVVRYAPDGGALSAVLPAEPTPGLRGYLCAFETEAGERSWLVVDVEAEDAVRALQQTIGTPPQLASPARLDEIGAATRRLEQALDPAAPSPFTAALKQVQPTGGPDEQAVALRDAMRVLFPEAVALVSAARQGFMREH